MKKLLVLLVVLSLCGLVVLLAGIWLIARPKQDTTLLTQTTRQYPKLPTISSTALASEPGALATATATMETPTSQPEVETPTATLSPHPSSLATLPPTPSPAPTLPRTPSPAPTLSSSPTPSSSATSSPSPAPSLPPASEPIYGVEMTRLKDKRKLSFAQDAGVYWIRRNGLSWVDIEPSPSARQWEAAEELEADLKAAYAADLQTVLIVRQTPAWAQKVPGHSCGPVAPEALDAMARFLADAVARYKDPPFGVKYWEIGNEPDVDPSLVAPDATFGCWGDQTDPTYGGEYYAQMLKAVYPAIKAVDPEANVLIGGLLLDREPALDESPNPPGRFLEGILQSGGGEYFDIVSYHAYTFYNGKIEEWDMNHPAWKHRGGIINGKVAFLREVLAAHGYDKPLMLTEAGLLCSGCSSPPSEEFLEAQASYVPRLYARTIALDLKATIWFTLDGPGWRQAGLLERQRPRPGYHALKAMTSLLEDARYLRPVSEYAGLEGYVFQQPEREMWVLWSPQNTRVRIPVPSGFKQAYALMGTPLETNGDELEIGFEPVYLELSVAR